MRLSGGCCGPIDRPHNCNVALGRNELPLQMVQLPTYAPWTNPIERLWRWLYQDVLHMHLLADDLVALKARVAAFLDRFTSASPDLLR